MIRIVDRKACCGCAACESACPHGAIRMRRDPMGFPYPEVDTGLCVDCGICESTCAFAPAGEAEHKSSEAITFPSLLGQSQSGGLAYAVMHKAINLGYVVYGAALNKDFTVSHVRVVDKAGLEALRLSKYVQSSMDGVPSQVLEDLRQGRKVLFTGTPCQCAGVGSLCASFRDKLLLADILCHGVPSPSVWKGFLAEESAKKGKEITSVMFRDPLCGWHKSIARLDFGQEAVHTGKFNFLFLNNLINRPSCSECPFASVSRPTDITMGDCWGIEKVLPGFAGESRPASLLIAHTSAGASFTADFEFEAVRTPVDLSSVMQESLSSPCPRPSRADSLEKDFARGGFGLIDSRYGENSPCEITRRVLHKLNPANTKLYKRLTR